ncbi:competence type IV pilus ATPase ComGA [Piscibacillus sp. B03]|uniref:competence type IV pilus ATPase ComGA n=1 Tax=Piscibacillus sp. B03 TaxID=3457430 RepID=UPI003FCC5F3E
MFSPDKYSYKMLSKAIDKSASDIHFTPKDHHIEVYFRVNGYRWFYESLSMKSYHNLLRFFKFNSGMDIAEKRLPQNGTILHQTKWHSYDLRLSTLPTKVTESLAIRIIPKDVFPNIESLFLFPNQAKHLLNWINHRAGMLLFTGATGSGKTTTMYSLIRKSIELYGYQAITLEDPVEQQVDNLLQVQVNENSGFSYDVGLKAALRHDPDIILVGEIRDENTAKFAFKAALTGHLVLSTIHAKDAFGTISRLKAMGLSDIDLQETIIGIASQQLLTISQPFKRPSIRRAAIAEILSGKALSKAIEGVPPSHQEGYQSFQSLRRKAYALGFIKQTS